MTRKKYKDPHSRLTPEERIKREKKLEKAKVMVQARAERQKRFLECYEKTGNGNINQACKAAGIKNTAVYKWIRIFPHFAKRMMLVDEQFLDEVQGALYDRATGKRMTGDREAQIYIMKTKGRHRGFGEHQTIEADITQRISQDRIDAIVRANEKIVIGMSKLPESVVNHLNKAIDSRTRQIPETFEAD